MARLFRAIFAFHYQATVSQLQMFRRTRVFASSHLSKGATVLYGHTSAEVCQIGALHLWKGETRKQLLRKLPPIPPLPGRRQFFN